MGRVEAIRCFLTFRKLEEIEAVRIEREGRGERSGASVGFFTPPFGVACSRVLQASSAKPPALLVSIYCQRDLRFCRSRYFVKGFVFRLRTKGDMRKGIINKNTTKLNFLNTPLRERPVDASVGNF